MKLGYVIIYVPHVLKALEFYERAFGLTRRFVHESGEYAELETGSTALAFVGEAITSHTFVPNRPESKAAGVEVAFVINDVEDAYKRAVEAGATPVTPPTKKPWGQVVSYVRDENGFLVEICSPIG